MRDAFRYRPEAACWALTLLAEIRAEEPAVTSDIVAAAAAAGGICHALANRMKAPDSLARKLSDTFDTAGDIPEQDLAPVARSAAADALRYTIETSDHDCIVPALMTTIDQLRSAGWTPVEVKDSYLPGNTYKGLHLMAVTPAGRTVEVQIHSTASITVKDAIHTDYEIVRDNSNPRQVRREAEQRCIAASAGISDPAGLADLYPEDSTNEGRAATIPIRKKAYTESVERRRR